MLEFRSRFILFVLFVCIPFTTLSPAFAVIIDPVLDRHMVRDSDFIFLGVVVAIDYKMSEVQDREEFPLPHTFVTFEIQKILKGNIQQQDLKNITLRFQGGRGEEAQFLRISGAPLFDLRDEGIFFVRENGDHICPLVGWRQGWTRIINGEIYSSIGEEILLSEDPILAARIHPLDIRDYPAFFERLQRPQRMIDRILWDILSPETRLLIQNLDSVQKVQPEALQFMFPERLLVSEKLEEDFFLKLMPISFRTIPRNISHTLLYRDLNLLLLQRNFFTPNNVGDLTLRERTRELLGQNQNDMALENVMLLNRRILEDAYPEILTKSLDQTVVNGKWVMLDEVMTHRVSETLTTMAMVDTPGDEQEPSVDEDPIMEGKRLSMEEYMEFTQVMIDTLHTPEELRLLPAVQNVNINEPIFVSPLPEVQIGFDLIAPPASPANSEERLELELFLSSGGNPVIKR